MTEHSHASEHAEHDGCCDHDHDHEHHEHDHTGALAPPSGEPFTLSWRVVSYIYGGGAAICLVLGALHAAGIEQVKGFYLIFSLFPFCLLYSLYQLRFRSAEAQLKKKNE